MHKMRYFMLGIILIIASGCGSELAQNGSEVLKIKGLYLGMNIDDACKIMNSLLDGPYKVIKIDQDTKNKYAICDANGTFDTSYATGMCIAVFADTNKNVIDITMMQKAVDKIFNVANIDTVDFIKEFVHAYKIPQMEPSYDETVERKIWKYQDSENGYKITIDEYKTINISATPKKSEMKLD